MRLLSGEGSDCWLCHRRRLHAALVRGGEQAREELVRQLMRELGLVACQPAPWRPQTTQ